MTATIVHAKGVAAKVPTSFILGKVIGQYMGQAIYDKLTDNHGVIRVFNGVVTKDMNPKAAFKPNCVITGNGLLYEPA